MAYSVSIPLDDWLHHIQLVISQHPESFFNNRILGEPSIANGLELMWQDGLSPLAALHAWCAYPNQVNYDW